MFDARVNTIQLNAYFPQKVHSPIFTEQDQDAQREISKSDNVDVLTAHKLTRDPAVNGVKSLNIFPLLCDKQNFRDMPCPSGVQFGIQLNEGEFAILDFNQQNDLTCAPALNVGGQPGRHVSDIHLLAPYLIEQAEPLPDRAKQRCADGFHTLTA